MVSKGEGGGGRGLRPSRCGGDYAENEAAGRVKMSMGLSLYLHSSLTVM